MPEAFTIRRGVKLVAATHNEGKVRELGELFTPYGIALVSAASLGLPEPDETGATFEENARLKAVAAAEGSGLPAIADDSGLEVAALDGEPGIHSARWGGAAKDFSLAMARVKRELTARGVTDMRANFTCSLALSAPGGEAAAYEGKAYGKIVWPPRGERGFGYDPIFVPDGYNETFGEMDPGLNNRLSHRIRAFEKLMQARYRDD